VGDRPRNTAQKFESSGRRKLSIITVVSAEKRHRQTDRQTDGNVTASFFGATRTTTVIRMGRLFHGYSRRVRCLLGMYQQFCGTLFKNDIYVGRILKDRHVRLGIPHTLLDKKRYFYTIKTLVTPRSKSATDKRRAKCR